MTEPLSGIRVVEYHAGVAAAIAGLFLRDAGAEVIKIEPPGGDASRCEPGNQQWNRGKQSVVAAPGDGGEAALLASADVVVIGGGARSIDGWKRQPHQVVCFAPPYGDLAALASLPESDALAAALAGILGGTGAYRPGPAYNTIPTLSYSAGLMMATGAIAALLVRAKSGVGQEVGVPWTALGAYFSGYQASESDRIPTMPSGGGAAPDGLSVGWRVYRAADGWMGVACANPVFFQRLCVALERPEIISDPRFQTAPFVFNPADRDELQRLIGEAFAARSRAEWVRVFEEHGVPASTLLTREQFLASDLVRENRLAVTAAGPGSNAVQQVAVPYSISGCDLAPPALPPGPGASGPTPQRPPSSAGSGPLPAHPLAGIRVLDFTGFLAGPTAGRILAELGAEVIKVEPPEGEGFRIGGLSCVGVNLGKKGVAIDQARPEGREVRDRLVRSADVVMHALLPGAPERLGLDYSSVEALRPGIIHCWIRGFGVAGQWRARPSFDLLLQALTGQMFALGSEEQPIYSSIPMADLSGGMLSVHAIVLALYLREKDRQGRSIELNQVGASMAARMEDFVDYPGRPGPRLSANAIGRSALERLYPVADGWALLDVRDPGAWERLRAAHPGGLAPWPSFDVAAAQPAEGALADALATFLAPLSRRQVFEQLAARGIPCAPAVIVREDRISNEWFRAAGALIEGIEHASFGALTAVGDFFRFSATPSRPPALAQWVGEHNREVLAGLGYTEAEVDRLFELKAIATSEFRPMRL
ncbi:MAG: CoA transferase [Thermoflexaceae bacterium]|nr:CoA transferase [Thermoflexaceae bacterium]